MWTEKVAELHKDPINWIFHIVAFIVVAYGLWMHGLATIVLGLFIAVLGHIIEEAKKKKRRTKEAKNKNKIKRKKKGALEMSIGTIVIMVIAVTMLILGIVFVRSIMCAGIIMSEEISNGMKGEITKLFGSEEYGVKCMGQGTSDATLGSGGRRSVVCMIRVEENIEYEIKLARIESLKGASTETVKKWVLKDEWSGTVKPGGDGTDVKVVILDIPDSAPTTTLDMDLEATDKNAGTKETINSQIDIRPASFITSTMC